jgi:hypothetical protein
MSARRIACPSGSSFEQNYILMRLPSLFFREITVLIYRQRGVILIMAFISSLLQQESAPGEKVIIDLVFRAFPADLCAEFRQAKGAS